MTQTNVLLLVVDSLRYDAIYGPNKLDGKLPTFERLDSEGITFSNCVSQGVSTAPAMTAMLTGRYPLDYGGHWYLEKNQPTFAQQFKNANYTTGAVHSNPYVSARRNFDRGFDIFKEDTVAFEPDRSLERAPEKLRRLASRVHRIASKRPYTPAQETNEQILSFIDSTSDQWFCWAQYMDVHGPYLGGTETYRKKFRSELLWRKAAVRSPEDITPAEHEQLWKDYRGDIAYLDTHIGNLLDALNKRDELDETIIVLTADHGDEFSEHGAYGHGNLPYDELTHVPLVMRFPPNIDVDALEVTDLVRSVDILPTVLDAVDASLGETMKNRCEGRSLLPALNRRPVNVEYALTEKRVRDEEPLRIGFRDEDWTFLYDGKEEQHYLYNRQTDPEEQVDVIGEFPDVRKRFKSLLKDRLSRIKETSENVTASDILEDAGVEEQLRALGYRE